MAEQNDGSLVPSSSGETNNSSPQHENLASTTMATTSGSSVDNVKGSNPSLSELDPPASRLERLRDKWLKFLGGKIHFWIGVVVMLLIIADGALFFFLLVGAQHMCRPRTDCEPRNYWYNWSIQFLNVLFTYLATISLPWRVSNAAHLFGRKRQSTSGLDLYGQPSEEIWYHIRQRKRRWIVVFLLLNSLTQYANQVSRILYYSYELQDTSPGNIWTNVFFLASMVCAALGGFVQLYEEEKVRKEHPESFPPSPGEVAKQYLQVVICRSKVRGNEILCDEEDQMPLLESERKRYFDNIRKWFKNDRSSLNMWGL